MSGFKDQDHRALQHDVTTWLKKAGFYVLPFGYHDVVKDEAARGRLSLCDTFASLSARAATDLLVVHKTLDLCAKIELKTTREQEMRNTNMLIEALPLALHLQTPGECLYICRLISASGAVRIDAGFWATSLAAIPPITKLVIPPRWATTRIGFQRRMTQYLRGVFQNMEIWEPEDKNGGSSDPYVVIEPAVLADTTLNWQRVLSRWYLEQETERPKTMMQFSQPSLPLVNQGNANQVKATI